ncbi:MAG: cyclopropane fatty acyl phospholipid synthase [Synergistes jonesii]|uniref:cyclopropane fatty acyl phospholipid synthase n=1 Tax=Synergistes jonesii TaxID=2754 RepID=UPI002A74DA66|nr:cyclopropane fatty acyl phospholipid synthase [Synergistes jonesii]MDY2984074.1 cyclopropane fatty acyl phospholipid synthase [Synergistes jonesii]
MSYMFPKIVQQRLASVGIEFNGPHEWDPQIVNDGFYRRVIAEKSLGLGESYMDGWWNCRRVDELLCRILKCGVEYDIKGSPRYALLFLPAKLLNLQSRSRSRIVAEGHYDIGNDFFFSFLDPLHQYSCAYFKDTDDLAQAQINKLELIAKKLELREGDSLLDIGCGWGGLAKYMALRYGCRVTGVNISKEQLAFAREECKGLPVEFIDCDYREIKGEYDKIISVGMFEHVGQKNFRAYMETVHRVLRKDGLFLLHTIGSNASRLNCDPWLNKYIFPNGALPSVAQMSSSAEGLFVIEDLQNLCDNYDKTLLCWYRNFIKAWPAFADKYGERFRRMWEYYLLCCAGVFRARGVQVFQLLMTRERDARRQPAAAML